MTRRSRREILAETSPITVAAVVFAWKRVTRFRRRSVTLDTRVSNAVERYGTRQPPHTRTREREFSMGRVGGGTCRAHNRALCRW